MRYYKIGDSIIATIGNLNYPEITKEEYDSEMMVIKERMKAEAEQAKLPPTESERLEALEAAFMEFVEVVMMGG